MPLPKATEIKAAKQAGAQTFRIPQGGEIPKVLLDKLPESEAPKEIKNGNNGPACLIGGECK